MRIVKERPPFKISELAIAIILLAGLVAAGVYAIDPKERALSDRDEMYKESSKAIIEGIGKYYREEGRLPWETDEDNVGTPSALPWTKFSDPKVGVCNDSSCTSPGVVANGEFLTLGAVNSKQNIFVAKGNASNSLLYACFIPESRAGRVDFIPLFSLQEGKEFPPGERPEVCPSSPDWSNSFCYQCVSEKLGTPKSK